MSNDISEWSPGALPPWARQAVRRSDRVDDARVELSAAVTMLSEMEMARWLPEAEAELAEAR